MSVKYEVLKLLAAAERLRNPGMRHLDVTFRSERYPSDEIRTKYSVLEKYREPPPWRPPRSPKRTKEQYSYMFRPIWRPPVSTNRKIFIRRVSSGRETAVGNGDQRMKRLRTKKKDFNQDSSRSLFTFLSCLGAIRVVVIFFPFRINHATRAICRKTTVAVF